LPTVQSPNENLCAGSGRYGWVSVMSTIHAFHQMIRVLPSDVAGGQSCPTDTRRHEMCSDGPFVSVNPQARSPLFSIGVRHVLSIEVLCKPGRQPMLPVCPEV
jgi:hypothetical protein